MSPSITISDPTLRDGNHAIGHQITAEMIRRYCEAVDAAGVPIVEVGHGNGLGASSLQLGESACSDQEMLAAARGALKRSKLGVHIIPGFATIDRDLAPALDAGVDIVRVASHVTEADLCERHIRYVKDHGRTAYGVLMMSHMIGLQGLGGQARKLADYGADAVILMDSAGIYKPIDVAERIGSSQTACPIGFHGHNNLGLAVANSIEAVRCGATIIDGTARGFGAGAGNTPIEILVALLGEEQTGIDLAKLFAAVELADQLFPGGAVRTTPSPLSICMAAAGLFSGFAKPIQRAAQRFGVPEIDIIAELGQRQVVAGQEDLIVEVAAALADRQKDRVP